MHKSSNRSLQTYEKATGRAIPVVNYNSPPNEGKVILNVVKHGRSKQISVHPRHLFPWEPVVDGEVVIVKGAWLGTRGIAKIKQGNQWVVTFSIDNDVRDFVFKEMDLTVLEASK